MKKLLFIMLLATQIAFAQDSTAFRRNEFRVDLLSLVTAEKLNLTYERFLNRDFSVGLTGSYSNSSNLTSDYNAGYRNNLPKYEVIPFVRYNLSKSAAHFYFAEASIAANGGDFREVVRQDDGTTGYYVIQNDDYFDIAIGGSIGYKLYFNQKFAVEFLVGFGSNLIDRSKSPDVVSRVGLSAGYRF